MSDQQQTAETGQETAAADAAGADKTAAATPPALLDQLSGDYRTVAERKGWKSPDDVLKSYVSLEAKVGADKVPLPPKTAEGKRDFSDWQGWDQLGRPKDPAGYEVKPIEGQEFTDHDKAFHDAMRPHLHKAGVTQAQLDTLGPGFTEVMSGLAAQQEAAVALEVDQTEAALKTEWGAQFKNRMDDAGLAAAKLGGDELLAELDRLGMGRSAPVLKALSKVGAMLKEDGKLGMVAGGGEMTAAEAKARIAALQGDKAFLERYQNRQHPGHQSAVEEMQRLFNLQASGKAA